MATRDNPNSHFSWFNDDDRLGIVERQSNTYDTYTGSTVTNGIRMTIHSKYETAENLTDDLQTTCGLNETMHINVLDYVKARILEDQGNFENASFFMRKYKEGITKAPTRKSGVRVLLVPEL